MLLSTSNLRLTLCDVAHKDRYYANLLYKIKKSTRLHRLHKKQKDYRSIKWYDEPRYLTPIHHYGTKLTLSNCMSLYCDNDSEDN